MHCFENLLSGFFFIEIIFPSHFHYASYNPIVEHWHYLYCQYNYHFFFDFKGDSVPGVLLMFSGGVPRVSRGFRAVRVDFSGLPGVSKELPGVSQALQERRSRSFQGIPGRFRGITERSKGVLGRFRRSMVLFFLFGTHISYVSLNLSCSYNKQRRC